MSILILQTFEFLEQPRLTRMRTIAIFFVLVVLVSVQGNAQSAASVTVLKAGGLKLFSRSLHVPGASYKGVRTFAVQQHVATPTTTSGVQVKQQPIAARRKDPKVQLWPEVSADIIGGGHLREGETKAAISSSSTSSPILIPLTRTSTLPMLI